MPPAPALPDGPTPAPAIPSSLRAVPPTAEALAAWVAALPATLRAVQEHWQLELGAPYEPGGQTAWVAPARSAEHGEVVLKVLWRHDEAEHEADGLRTWDGRGAVRLLDERALPDTTAMLLERAVPGTALTSRPEEEQDEIVAALLRRLWIEPPPPHPFRDLTVMCDRWAAGRERRRDAEPPGEPRGEANEHLDPGLVRAGIELFRALPREATARVLLATDLHAGNVLAAQREPWLAIDPKPYVGDPTYDALQHLLNCPSRLHTDPDALVRRMASLLELDANRLRLWLFARCTIEDTWRPALADVARRLAPT